VAKSSGYGHYCVIARALEVIGEKWSLLLIRDLLRGPQRFSDLQRDMGNITPKWLTARLRELEKEGIIERESTPGKREVWYRLTDKGRDFAPVVESLAGWGIKHARREPLAGEPLFPEMFLQATAVSLNRSRRKPPGPVAWEFRFGDTPRPVTLRYDGERWTSREVSGDADAVIETSPGDLLAFLNADLSDRRDLHKLEFAGDRKAIDEFRRTFTERGTTKVRAATTAR
jgi:DNA-binding HxlR family transcriptional regulator